MNRIEGENLTYREKKRKKNVYNIFHSKTFFPCSAVDSFLKLYDFAYVARHDDKLFLHECKVVAIPCCKL